MPIQSLHELIRRAQKARNESRVIRAHCRRTLEESKRLQQQIVSTESKFLTAKIERAS